MVLLEALEAFLAECVAQSGGRTRWVDQDTSPLGRRHHLRAFRAGTLPGTKVGKRVLVEEADLAAYIEKHRSINSTSDTDEAKQIAAALDALGVEPSPCGGRGRG
jgi:hypothetical protein